MSLKIKIVTNTLNWLSLVVAILSILVMVGKILSEKKIGDPHSLTIANIESSNSIDSTTVHQITNLEVQVESLKAKLEKKIAADSIIFSNSKQIELKLLRYEMQEIQRSIRVINEVILESPEKAIALPLVKLQIDEQKKESEKNLQFLSAEIERVYDMNKWIFGIMISLLVSIIIINISNLINRKKKEDHSEGDTPLPI